MAGLTITDSQASIIQTEDPYLDTAFRSGVVDSSNDVIVNPMLGYTRLSSAQAASVRLIFNDCMAAFTKAANLTAVLPSGITATVTLAKLTGGGSNGSLTFTSGILTSMVAPT